jgi:hypothetical protein
MIHQQIIEHNKDYQRPWLYLSGETEQNKIIETLAKIDGSVFTKQLIYLANSDIISFWFTNKNSHIQLLDLGTQLARIKINDHPLIIVGMEEDYQYSKEIIIYISAALKKDVTNMICKSIEEQIQKLHLVLQAFMPIRSSTRLRQVQS